MPIKLSSRNTRGGARTLGAPAFATLAPLMFAPFALTVSRFAPVIEERGASHIRNESCWSLKESAWPFACTFEGRRLSTFVRSASAFRNIGFLDRPGCVSVFRRQPSEAESLRGTTEILSSDFLPDIAAQKGRIAALEKARAQAAQTYEEALMKYEKAAAEASHAKTAASAAHFLDTLANVFSAINNLSPGSEVRVDGVAAPKTSETSLSAKLAEDDSAIKAAAVPVIRLEAVSDADALNAAHHRLTEQYQQLPGFPADSIPTPPMISPP
ncbi:hypothetical protein [Caballeronia novacaledonica]|uniref:Uncharacterized protein n=1 Tax=Caballeronia novacaledonica TaxID=1544861 RepID=A0AA37MS72_9BURK|nr:hypothetical protein [Caballeronia novacaledonica]GJH29326.1 hypothetical protein CBA19CS42_32440 [Caballeronia novacaledonica]